MPVVHITSDAEFNRVVSNTNNNAGGSGGGGGGDKLFVVDFGASWCGPCKQIAPVFEQLSNKYSHSNFQFLHVDVDECTEVAQEQGVRALPTFVFYKNNPETELTRIQGASAEALESKVLEYSKQYKPYFSGEGNKLGGSSSSNNSSSLPPSLVGTSSSINLSPSELISMAQSKIEFDEASSCKISLRFQPSLPSACVLSGGGGGVKPSLRINPSSKVSVLREFIDTLFELSGIESTRNYKLHSSYPPKVLDEEATVAEAGVAGALVIVKFC